MSELPTSERIILAIDTSSEQDAERLAGVSQAAGARFVKLGLELSSATSWQFCADLAAGHGLDWVADAKLDDIPTTVVGAVRNIAGLSHPPFGITMHTTAGFEAMRQAQEEAGDVKMLGVTVLTSISGKAKEGEEKSEAERMYHTPLNNKVMELAMEAARANLAGIVCSPLEVSMIKRGNKTRGLFAMIPGTRPAGSAVQDQERVATPGEAIRDGADLLVIGRPITQAENPAEAYDAIVDEIEIVAK